jgi:tetratricopeptide (TPR) repeat protein
MRTSFIGVGLTMVVSGCATYVDAQREQHPIFSVQSELQGIGLVDVSIPDDVLARAPNDFSNMTGLIAKTMRDYVEARGGFSAMDYTHLGFKAKWERGYATEPAKLRSVEGVPAGAQTPLVTAVRVLNWRTYTEGKDQALVDVAQVRLQFSTWTKDGREVYSEVIEAIARANDFQLHLKAGDQHIVRWFQHSDGRKGFDHQPKERAELFMNALREAVSVHLYPFFPHKVMERLVLIDDEPLKPGVQAAVRGNWEEAFELWKGVSEKDPKSHGALYNMGLIHLIKGEDEQALAHFERAVAIKDTLLYSSMANGVSARMKLRKTITVGGVSAAPGS